MNELLKEALDALNEMDAYYPGDFHRLETAKSKIEAALSSVEAKPVADKALLEAVSKHGFCVLQELQFERGTGSLAAHNLRLALMEVEKALTGTRTPSDVKIGAPYPLDGIKVASPLASVEAQSRLSDDQIIAIAKTWAKEPGWLEFERNDFIACVRQCLSEVRASAVPQVMLNGLTEEETSATASVLGLTQRASSAEGAVSSHGKTEAPQRPQPQAEPSPEVERDARRYRFLRKQHWHESALGVVRDPKKTVKPGTDCPSGSRLDEFIDAALSAEGSGGAQ